MPYTNQWDEAKAVPKVLFEKCAEAGWLAAVVGAPWQTKYLLRVQARKWKYIYEEEGRRRGGREKKEGRRGEEGETKKTETKSYEAIEEREEREK
jgi:hypothetical protein